MQTVTSEAAKPASKLLYIGGILGLPLVGMIAFALQAVSAIESNPQPFLDLQDQIQTLAFGGSQINPEMLESLFDPLIEQMKPGLALMALSWLAVIGLFIKLVQASWAALREAGDAEAPSPWGMALLLLIPVFNFYWTFRAGLGWVRRYNQLLDARGWSRPRFSESLMQGACVTWILTILPTVGVLFALVNSVLVFMLLGRVIDEINWLAEQSGATQAA
ncbi:hypothetical protein [Magnetofaba australis]|nr:hypothetical protein [Magnetofaba australis]